MGTMGYSPGHCAIGFFFPSSLLSVTLGQLCAAQLFSCSFWRELCPRRAVMQRTIGLKCAAKTLSCSRMVVKSRASISPANLNGCAQCFISLCQQLLTVPGPQSSCLH